MVAYGEVQPDIFPYLPTPTILLQKSDECAPMTIDFVLLRSPRLCPHDPETIIVSREHRFIRGLCPIVT